MKIKPMGDRVLLEVEKVAAVQEGISIPESMRQKKDYAVVRRLGSEATVGLKVGDKVVIPSVGGKKITQGDKEFIVMKEEDIVAVLEE